MTFVRKTTEKWKKEVPGARWFKADLQVHTVDDHPGGRTKLPAGVTGDLSDSATLRAYARAFLQAAIANGVQVLGVTPHSPRTCQAPESSAVWTIVEEWNEGLDDDGTPFREKIFAVFPGFEPNVNNGGSGVHLLFLFDPEIGKDRYLAVFDAIMDGKTPWDAGSLQLTPRGAADIFETIDRHCQPKPGKLVPWQYVSLAPHFMGPHGVLREVKSQALQHFPCHRLAGFELQDEQLPEDFEAGKKPGSFLLPFMNEHRQAFFHSSDCYCVQEIGKRHVWIKMASPRIEALRQAFIACDSRMRIGFKRGAGGELVEVDTPPDVTLSQRYWLRSVSVTGGSSFFGGKKSGSPTEFELSPDLTCVIGGSMTGKSTFLDGLRESLGVQPPKDSSLATQVSVRAEQFLAGSPDIELDFPNPPPEVSDAGSRLAVFFTQGELQRLAYESGSEREILANLDLDAKPEIEGIEQQLCELDESLANAADDINRLESKRAEAGQAVQIAREATEALKVFAKVGVDQLHAIEKRRLDWKHADKEIVQAKEHLKGAMSKLKGLEMPELGDEDREALSASGIDPNAFMQQPTKLLEVLKDSLESFSSWLEQIQAYRELLQSREREVRTCVEKSLAEQGYDASKIREFQGLSRQAALLKSYEANLNQIENQIKDKEDRFKSAIRVRLDLINQQRRAFDRVIESIESDFNGLLRARRLPAGDVEPLQQFLNDLNQRGVTRWWNSLESSARPSPEALADALEKDDLGDLGMSTQVQGTFKETMTRQRRRELLAIRCPDRYVIEQRMEGQKNEYRDLERLSGGRQVSVLLSLLLKTNDARMLVIDQPEDQLDNRFLFDEVLPALKALKGKRQIVLATHNANIVVNGDADQVIQLDATADKGRVACSGAIEEPEVRRAIVETVDGGHEAFRLRKLKYGF